MNIRNKRGQSTVEYVLLVTAVIGVIIVFETNKSTGFQQQLNTSLNTVTGKMTDVMESLDNSHNPSSGGGGLENTYTINVLPH